MQPNASQGELVLIEPGDSSRPDVATATRGHGGRGPNRRVAADVADPIAATASATTDPAGGGRSSPGSSRNANAVNSARSAPARAANRRSQSRTVVAGRPNRAAIGRCPWPVAFASSAAPITATASTRRSRHTTGINTCVTAQPAHPDRRGRSRSDWSRCRTSRCRAHPHGRSRPSQSGQDNRPARNSQSTRSRSGLTMCMCAPGHS